MYNVEKRNMLGTAVDLHRAEVIGMPSERWSRVHKKRRVCVSYQARPRTISCDNVVLIFLRASDGHALARPDATIFFSKQTRVTYQTADVETIGRRNHY